jgi:hypothetical protein
VSGSPRATGRFAADARSRSASFDWVRRSPIRAMACAAISPPMALQTVSRNALSGKQFERAPVAEIGQRRTRHALARCAKRLRMSPGVFVLARSDAAGRLADLTEADIEHWMFWLGLNYLSSR